jgi:hypothetical protein
VLRQNWSGRRSDGRLWAVSADDCLGLPTGQPDDSGYTAGPFSRESPAVMERFLEFAANHYLLVTTFVALLVAWIVTEMARGGKNVSPQGLSALVNQHNARLIDVRDPAEFKAGHISGSENIPYSRISERLRS